MRMLSVFLVLFVTACASVEAESPKQRLYALQSEFTAVAGAAAAYIERPDCSDTIVVRCGDPRVKRAIKKAAVKAHDAIGKARSTVDVAESEGWRAVAVTAITEIANYLAGAAK